MRKFALVALVVLVASGCLAATNPNAVGLPKTTTQADRAEALSIIAKVATKGRGPKTGYSRDRFGPAWTDDQDAIFGHNGCDTRNDILKRDLSNATFRSPTSCAVTSGSMVDPYTDRPVTHTTHGEVGIDHVVPLSYAWQMGASGWPAAKRIRFANDPLNLIATASPVNSAKGDSGPASWLPPSKTVRCAYVTRFAAVANEYGLAVTASDKSVMAAQCA